MAIFSDDLFYVRKLEEEDIDSFYDLLSSKKVMRYVKAPLSFYKSKEELKRFISYYDRTGKYYHIWAIIDISNNEFLGICGVYLNTHREFEIAYRLREKYWGKGLGSKVAKGLISYCQLTLGIRKLVAYVHKKNVASVIILQKLLFLEQKQEQIPNKAVERKFTLLL